MKTIASIAITLALAAPAWAQGLPQGSYMQSCGNAHIEGDTLVAVCRRMNGDMLNARLPDVFRCVGDIGNNNGNLQCSYGDQEPGRAPGR